MQIDPISIGISNSILLPAHRISKSHSILRSEEIVLENYDDSIEISENWDQKNNTIQNTDIKYLSKLLPEPQIINLGLLSAKHISDLLDKELAKLSEQLNAALKDSIDRKIQDDFRALEGSSASLDSYNDHEIAIVGPIYKTTIEEAIDLYLADSLFEIQNILTPGTVTDKQDWEYSPEAEEDKPYLMYSHIFDLIIYYLLLKEKCPLGNLSFHIKTNFSNKNRNYFEIDFSLKQKNNCIDQYKFSYYPKQKLGELYCKSRNSIEKIKFDFFTNGKVQQYYGTIQNHLMLKKIIKNGNVKIEKIIIGNWKLDVNTKQINVPHKWKKKNSAKTKIFQQRSKTIQKNKQFYLVSKYIQLGEDYIYEIVLFKKGIPIPIAGGGLIINNTESVKIDDICLPKHLGVFSTQHR